MSYSLKVIKKSEQITTLWSGGKTTQLAIYPEDGNYLKRDFKWRISTAEIEVDESLFTHLPGIKRIITILEGEMSLKHKGKQEVHLFPFEQHRFDGGWETRSFGKVTDFNLMLAEGCEGDLSTIHLDDGIHHLPLDQNQSKRRFHAFYCVKGTSEMSINQNEAAVLGEGDILVLNLGQSCNNLHVNLTNYHDSTATIIQVSIFH
ncbi:HutD family protein [Peribacillus sp. SI8-4]|uniref:HutD/Ves family protein n=1 Tax=Peribacillus sp. SI8-4 TaxID=3048009 RepID=UPI0025548AF3|nr:HutD family protein [Peribacillus sp. SI8-4]